MNEVNCERNVVWHGIVEKITVKNHNYAWTGRMPCTGVRACVFCGKLEPETKHDPHATIPR